VKLLLDENLSPQLVRVLEPDYPARRMSARLDCVAPTIA
jgi:predicted nuclease of predicted toxin-antitoxin system